MNNAKNIFKVIENKGWTRREFTSSTMPTVLFLSKPFDCLRTNIGFTVRVPHDELSNPIKVGAAIRNTLQNLMDSMDPSKEQCSLLNMTKTALDPVAMNIIFSEYKKLSAALAQPIIVRVHKLSRSPQKQNMGNHKLTKEGI